MTYADHLKNCNYCNKSENQLLYKPTIRIKSASSYRKRQKLEELSNLIRGVSYSTISYPMDNFRSKAKSASSADKSHKLKELAKLVKGV